MNKFNTFMDAFLYTNKLILESPDYMNESRLGPTREIIGFNYGVSDPSQIEFTDPRISRLDYEYANTFYEFMLSGGGLKDARKEFKDYSVSRFLENPPGLPANFNTLYGPRLLSQLSKVVGELKKRNSRRAVVCILEDGDNVLYDTDTGVEYPCTISFQFFIREGELHLHTNMRSQNCVTVLKLDMYLNARLMQTVAEMLSMDKLGNFTSSIGSMHMYDRDVAYVKSFLE